MAVAWLAGASGLVGGEVLRRLLEGRSFEAVVSFGRRTLSIEHAKLRQVRAELTDPAALASDLTPDVALSCLGTTLAKAGSREAFRAVDLGAVASFARAARSAGARAFLHVSALGADPRSRVFYSAVKGEVEEAVARLGFDAVYAFRPSLLDGERQERRLGEHAALVAARALAPLLGKYRPTPVTALAQAMVALAAAPAPGVHVVAPQAITSGAALAR